MTITDATTEDNSRSISQARFLEVLRSADSDDLPDYRLQCLLWSLMIGHVEPADVWPTIFAENLDALDDLIHDDWDKSGSVEAVASEHRPEQHVPGYCVCGELLHGVPPTS